MGKIRLSLVLVFMLVINVSISLLAQQDTIEIYIIDNFVTPELPHKLMLSFFTSEVCKSKLNINGTNEIIISNEPTDNHKIQIDLTNYALVAKTNYFTITVEGARGNSYTSEKDEFEIPKEIIVEGGSNFFRTGYKHIIAIPGLEYVSPGLNYVTNFKGYNGISPEISLGLFKIFNTFTVYSRYRFSAKPGDPGSEFHEISLGLYSGFFAIYF